MKGINGNILRVDLTAGRLSVQPISEEHYRRHLGGRGIIAHTLLTEVPKGIDPFGAENRLVFALGTLTGHPFVGSGRRFRRNVCRRPDEHFLGSFRIQFDL